MTDEILDHRLAPSRAWPSLRTTVELFKPLTWFAPVWAFGCGAVSAGGHAHGRLPFVVGGLVLAGPLVCGTSQAVNDWFDRHVDAINEPGRPVPSGRAPGRSALWLAVIGTLVSLAVATALGSWVLAAAVVALALAWAYSAPPLRLKMDGWLGPAAVAACYEGLPWITGAVVAAGAAPSGKILALAALYSVGAHGIMTLNDFKSIEGDRRMGVRSLPVRLGVDPAVRLACLVMALAQLAAAGLLAWWGRPLFAAGIDALSLVQILLMRRLLEAPREKAPWYNGTGTTLYVLGMLVAAFAVRGAVTARPLGWGAIARLGLVQAAVGALSVLATSTLSRIMIVELALPAIVPGVLVAAHYLVQASRPRFGHGADARRRRTPTVVGGMAAAAACAFAAAGATALMHASPWLGGGLAVVAFAGFGLGIGAAGTGLLTLLAERTAPGRRPAAATLTWLLMMVGFIVCAGVAGKALEPYSPVRLLEVSAAVSLAALALTALAVWGVEPRGAVSAAPAPSVPFREALRQVAAEPQTVRFALVIFTAMLAYSGQELLLEPLAGAVFGYSPGASTELMGMQRGGVLLGMLLTAAAGGVGARRGGAAGLGGWTAGGCVAAAAGLVAVAAGALSGPGFPIKPAVFLLGLGDGVFAVSAVGAMMARVGAGAPDREGVRMGVWGAAQAVAFGLGGVLATLTVDGVRAAVGAAAPAYATALVGEGALFVVAAALVLRSSIPAARATPSTLTPAPLTS